MAQARDEFFVGYLPMPPATRRFLFVIVALTVIGVLALGAWTAASQHNYGTGLKAARGETHAGIYFSDPYPHLLFEDRRGVLRGALLVGGGKHGVRSEDGWDKAAVRVEGNTLERDGSYMIEGPTVTLHDAAPSNEPKADHVLEALGTVTLSGEIVDSKCFFGKMKPGRGRVHRACAQLCIDGGVTPVLAVSDKEGRERHFALANHAGKSARSEVLAFVAEPVSATGELYRRGPLYFLFLSKNGLRRQ